MSAINSKIIQKVKDGEVDPIPVYYSIVQKIKELETYKDAILPETLAECDRFDKRELAEKGITVNNGRRTWSYKHIQAWCKVKAELTEIEEAAKHAAETNGVVVDDSTGEIIEKATFTTSSRSITFTKKYGK